MRCKKNYYFQKEYSNLRDDYVFLTRSVQIGTSDGASLLVSPIQHFVHRIEVDRDRMLDASERQDKIGVIGRIQGYSTDLVSLNDQQQLLRSLGARVTVQQLDARRTSTTVTALSHA